MGAEPKLLDGEMQELAPADQTAFTSPVPTQIVSGDGYNRLPQTGQQARPALLKQHSRHVWIGRNDDAHGYLARR